MAEKFKCEEPRCKKRGLTELMQISGGSANYSQYCIKNKRLGTIDQVKMDTLRKDGAKWRCATCFEKFLRRKKLETFYHLVEPTKPKKEVRHATSITCEEHRDQTSEIKGGVSEEVQEASRGSTPVI